MDPVSELKTRIECYFRPNGGFEVHSLRVSEYNKRVSTPFQLEQNDSVAFVVINTPAMFEKSFRPWIEKRYKGETLDSLQSVVRDPLDEFVVSVANDALADVQKESADATVLFDFSLCPRTRRPLVLMPTMGHAAGAAYYYRVDDLHDDKHPGIVDITVSTGKALLGVSVHPQYGSWFAYRCVIHCPSVSGSSIPLVRPQRHLHLPDDIAKLLYLFNERWREREWRSAGLGEKSAKMVYDNDQMEYFDTAPKERWSLIAKWMNVIQ